MLGVNSSAAHPRRHRPGAAAAAYSLALSILGDPNDAASIAVVALRKGAGSRTAVIAHARKEALAVVKPTAAGLDSPVASTDLRELAHQLADTRPALERAVVHLELRAGLDTSSFARVLGVTASRAGERSREISATWAAELDPAMMAWLGPGSCEALSTILRTENVWPRSESTPVLSSVDSTGPVPVLRTGTDGMVIEPPPAPAPVAITTVRLLLSTASVVHEHAQGCDICGERLRLLTPVRALFGQAPIEDVPDRVAQAARNARRRLPAPLPPSIERRKFDLQRLQVPAFGIIALVAVGAATIGLYRSHDDGAPSQASRVAKLVQDAPASRLLGTPTIVTPATKTASLANNGTSAISWTAVSDEPWVTLSPMSGRIQPSQSVSIAIAANPPANGSTDATITITGDDGSTQTLKYDSDGG